MNNKCKSFQLLEITQSCDQMFKLKSTKTIMYEDNVDHRPLQATV